MRISAIVAMSKNRVIGRENQLPWRLPEDLKRFRALTTDHSVLMGRKTFESIGRILPHRENIIITRQPNYRVPGARVVQSIEEGLSLSSGEKEIFVIGGAEIYRQTLSRVDRIYLTQIEQVIEGDAFFPEFSLNDFKEVSREDRTDPFEYSFLVFDRMSG